MCFVLLSSKSGYADPYPSPSSPRILLGTVAIAGSKEKFNGTDVLDALPLALSQSSSLFNPRIFLSLAGFVYIV